MDSSTVCSQGVRPEEVAAWALDGEPAVGIDLDDHVPGCEACRSVVAGVEAAGTAAAALRAAAPVAPAAVTERAVRRVRLETTSLLVLRNLGGAWLRVARALPPLVAGPRRTGSDLEDTGELPTVELTADETLDLEP